MGSYRTKDRAKFDKLLKQIANARQVFQETSQTSVSEWIAGGSEFYRQQCGEDNDTLTPTIDQDILDKCANDQAIREAVVRNLAIAKDNKRPITVLLGIGNTCVTKGKFDVLYRNGKFTVSNSSAEAVVVDDCNCGQIALNLDQANMEKLIRIITNTPLSDTDDKIASSMSE